VILSGGGNWLNLKEGDSVTGVLVSYECDVPSSNPAMGPQDIVTLDVDGVQKKLGAKTAVKNVMRNNRIEPGSVLRFTHKGKAVSKKGRTFDDIETDLVASAERALEFPGNYPAANQPMAANEPMSAEEQELNRRLEEARAKRRAS
jgi:DNA helicase TIP49 (TBP-interacting protein)